MPIEREEMQKLVRKYGKNPVILNLGSHSALDLAAGCRDFGLRRIIYTTKERAIIYLSNPMVGDGAKSVDDLPGAVRSDMIVVRDPADIPKDGWKQAILILDRYDEIMKYVDDLLEFEPLHTTNRAFAVYCGGDERCSAIEDKFPIPIVGSRRLLKIENRGEIEKDYYYFAEKAGIPHPRGFEFDVRKDGIKLKREVNEPLILKAEHKERKFERCFIFAANSRDLEEKVRKYLESGTLDLEGLKTARVEEYVPGVTANFNFFYSPIDARQNWGDAEKALRELYGLSVEDARAWLSNEFLSIDERRETTHDGYQRMPAEVQMKVDYTHTKYPLTFEVTAHLPMSLRESLLKEVHEFANKFLLAAKVLEPPGIIGPWCLQTLITWQEITGITGVQLGLYDAGEKVYKHWPVTQDIALRHGGGTNTHMGIGSQYANAKRRRILSMGDRIAMEIRRAINMGALDEIVT